MIHLEIDVSSVSILTECEEVFRRYDNHKATNDISKVTCPECIDSITNKEIGANI
tara:strand:+ start:162 stop:326 length:165 start_codon:yes stop_codon:yes gene_type:complete